MNMDMSQYIDVFIEESKEHLTNLNQRLLELENNPDSTAALNEIFRSAHTLKGMSSTMGFDDMADLTHHIENVISDLKEGLIRVTTSVVDVLFRCLDRLQVMVVQIQSGQSLSFDNSDLIEQLNNIKMGVINETVFNGQAERQEEKKVIESVEKLDSIPIASSLNEYDTTLLKEALTGGFTVYYIEVRVHPACLMKSVRAFMVFRALEEDGDILKAVPPAQELDEGKYDDKFHIILVSSLSEEQIASRLNSISEVEAGRIQKITLNQITDIKEPVVPIAVKKETQNKATDVVKTTTAENAAITEEALKTHKVKQTVRVDIERLDSLMNLVGELVINKGRLEQIGETRRIADLNEAIEQMERVTNELQNVVMKVRMVPIEQVFNRFPRMVRDLAKEMGKEIDFIIEGRETELDRTVIDEIGDPLVHLLRNAVDHGLEDPDTREKQGKPRRGLVKLVARHEGNNVFIEVMDDGKGLDFDSIRNKAIEQDLIGPKDAESLSDQEIIQFLFQPGFSTVKVISDISGRGVGLDVVKSKIESLNGEIYVESRAGAGTTFKIRLPLTLAIIQTLLVKVGNETYAIPLTSVDETTMIDKRDIKMVQSQEMILLRGNVLPLARARQLLEVEGEESEEDVIYVVVVRKGSKQIGLIVDSLIGQQEIVIKSLGKLMSSIPGIAGATILGDGGVSLILDIGTLIQ